jgi:hypothetical protein
MEGLMDIGIVNPNDESFIWYHTTHKDRLERVLEEGLIRNSEPVWQSGPEPWIYLSTVPWEYEGGVILEIDLSRFKFEYVGWAFANENSPKEEKWQLRCFVHIPPEVIKIHEKKVTNND